MINKKLFNWWTKENYIFGRHHCKRMLYKQKFLHIFIKLTNLKSLFSTLLDIYTIAAEKNKLWEQHSASDMPDSTQVLKRKTIAVSNFSH